MNIIYLNLHEPIKIRNQDFVFLFDTCDVNEIEEYFRDNGYPAAIISDCAKIYKNNNNNIRWFGSHTHIVDVKSLSGYQSLTYDVELQTDFTCNFFYNKKHISRHLTFKIVEYHDIPVNYFWSGINRHEDMLPILNELSTLDKKPFNESVNNVLLCPIQHTKKWFNDSFGDNDPDVVDPSITALPHGGDNIHSWENFFKPMMSNTAFSLIGESGCGFNQVSMFTWKTVFSILALTFPIWPGGYRLAEEFKQAGFDCFDDIIDHSYQYKETLVERCWHAINDNIHLLNDLDRAKNLRNRFKTRLLNNREKFLNGQWFTHIDKEVDSWDVPHEIKYVYKNNTIWIASRARDIRIFDRSLKSTDEDS